MTYALIFMEPESEFAKRESAEAPQHMGAWGKYIGDMIQAGVMAPGAGAGLEFPQTATTIRGELIQDGPAIDTKEQLGGFVLINVPSLDEAIVWAKRAPCVNSGAIEIRPVLAPPAQ